MILNLGCGLDKKPLYTNIDLYEEFKPEVVASIDQLPFKTESIQRVRAHHVLEHVPQTKVIQCMNEIHRVLKNGGLFEFETPSSNSRAAFQDPTHVSYWNINSWFYFFDTIYRQQARIKAKFKKIYLNDIRISEELDIIVTRGLVEKV